MNNKLMIKAITPLLWIWLAVYIILSVIFLKLDVFSTAVFKYPEGRGVFIVLSTIIYVISYFVAKDNLSMTRGRYQIIQSGGSNLTKETIEDIHDTLRDINAREDRMGNIPFQLLVEHNQQLREFRISMRR
jgi:hypothetical protein